jgi:hypothetical protein
LSKNNLISSWNPNVHHCVHKSPPLDPILSQLNPVGPTDPFLPKVQLNVILPPTPRSFQRSFRKLFEIKTQPFALEDPVCNTDRKSENHPYQQIMRVYPKVSGLAVWSENCKWYSFLPLAAVVSLFYESV